MILWAWLIPAFLLGVLAGIALLDYAASLGTGVKKSDGPAILAGPDVSPEEYRGVLYGASPDALTGRLTITELNQQP